MRARRIGGQDLLTCGRCKHIREREREREDDENAEARIRHIEAEAAPSQRTRIQVFVTWRPAYYTILYYNILYYTILHYTTLYCTILYPAWLPLAGCPPLAGCRTAATTSRFAYFVYCRLFRQPPGGFLFISLILSARATHEAGCFSR